MSVQPNTCEACGKPGVVSKTVKDFAYPTPMGLVTIEGETPIEECPSCNEIFLPGLLVEQWNRLIMTHLSRKTDELSAKEVQFLLKSLPYTRDEFCQLLSLDAELFRMLAGGAGKTTPHIQEMLRALMADTLGGTETVH
ncbi:MAG: hypothetical protein IT285_03135 [Bdellovibrionales bacterium]|nr:hypothetical protein [Bdellovibrionales bacterium]